MKLLDLGKYRSIVVSIALFLLLDASVLIMNFFISFEIADDAVGVNIAGRQRMLSQRTMKSLLDTEVNQEDPAQALAELQNTVRLFDKTLIAFDQGDVTPGATGEEVALEAVSAEKARAAVEQAKTLWQPYYNSINALLSAEPGSEQFNTNLQAAIAAGSASNLKLLELMNTLTVELEAIASSKATTLRMIQTVGISLALLNFFLIMFHFMRQLRESDAQIAAAQQETQEILETVNEGLFLIDDELRIGDQHSLELETILQRDDIAGHHFEDLLKNLVTEKDMNTTQSFIKLLFKPNVNENLIGDLNPLSQVEIHLQDANGVYQNKFLSFTFSRVATDDSISHVLVTVKDITEQVKLAKELDAVRSQNEQQMELLGSLLNTNSDLLPLFLDNASTSFNQINEALQQDSRSQDQYQQKSNRIYAIIHNFKGEASALGLDQFVDLAHEFEDELNRIKAIPKIGGKDFLTLTIMLNRLMLQVDQARGLAEKLRRFTASLDANATKTDTAMSWNHLSDMALSIAEKQGKEVVLSHAGLTDNGLPQHIQSALNSISIQFVRNAVSHGLETPSEREQAEKSNTGNIDIRLAQTSEGNYVYNFKDDGRGLDLHAIRDKALELGIVSEAKAEIMDSKQIISLIFSPELSTRKGSDIDAGRGIGMHTVRDMVKQINGKISIGSRTGQGCSFRITIPKQSLAINHAA